MCGYLTIDIAVTDEKLSKITMIEDSKLIDEVVVVGYGSMRKQDVTTSIARVGGKDLKDMPVTGFDQAIVGKMAGVQVTQTSGKPNSGATIRVRGTGLLQQGQSRYMWWMEYHWKELQVLWKLLI